MQIGNDFFTKCDVMMDKAVLPTAGQPHWSPEVSQTYLILEASGPRAISLIRRMWSTACSHSRATFPRLQLAPHITTAQELKREFNTGGSSATTSSDVENVYKVRSSGPHQHGRCLPLPHDFEAAGLGPCIKNRRGFHSTNDMTNHHADERETGIWADNAFTELSSSSCA